MKQNTYRREFMQQRKEDRRKTPRKDILTPAVMHLEANGKSFTSQAIIKNISPGGVFFALYDFDEELKNLDLENMPMRIRFRLSDTDAEYAASCCSKRTERLTYTIQMGAAFTDMLPEQHLALQQYCDCFVAPEM